MLSRRRPRIVNGLAPAGAASGGGSLAVSPHVWRAGQWRLAVIALGPFALSYFLSCILRAANAVVAPDLVRDVGLGPSELGLSTAVLLLAIAAMQLPLGLMLDRYGPRRVQVVLIGIGAAGTLLFALGHDAATLLGARALIGLGFAGSLTSGFKAVVLWVPETRRAIATAWMMASGALGLVVATTPLTWAVDGIGWRAVFLVLAVLTALVALATALVVPEPSVPPRRATWRDSVADIGTIVRDRAFLAVAPLVASTCATHIAVQTLWIGPWVRDVAGLDRAGVADSLLAVAAAFAAGILLSGAVADWCMRRGIAILDVMLAFLAVFLLAQFVIVADPGRFTLIAWLLFGMTGQAGVLAFTWLAGHFTPRLSGRVTTVVNLVTFLAAFGFQVAIGAVIEQYPTTDGSGYDPRAYQLAFASLLLVQIVAFVWMLAHRRLLVAADQAIAARRLVWPLPVVCRRGARTGVRQRPARIMAPLAGAA